MKSIWLMYHDIYEVRPVEAGPRTATMYHLPKDTFAKHISAIKELGCPVITVGEFLSGRGSSNSVVLTFDDGWRGAFEVAIPMLVEAGLRATFFRTRDFVGREGFCDSVMIIAAHKAGMEIGCHGSTHRMLSACSREEILWEWSSCKSFLESLLKHPVEYASLPGGDLNNQIIASARDCGLKAICTSIPGINNEVTDPFRIKRLAIRQNTDATTIKRYLRYQVVPEITRWSAFQIAPRVLGMRNYTKLRRWLVDSRAGRKELFKP